MRVFIGPDGQATVSDSLLIARLQVRDDCTPFALLDIDIAPRRSNFTCADVGLTFPFMVTATDLFDNEGECVNNIIVDDTLFCPRPLAGPYTVRGHVTLPQYASPAAFADIAVHHGNGMIDYATDASGYFVLGSVPAGAISITTDLDLPFGLWHE